MITIYQLVDRSYELDLSRDRDTGITAVVAGDGLDYGMYIFDREGEIIVSDECGFSSKIPYSLADEYLFEYLKRDATSKSSPIFLKA